MKIKLKSIELPASEIGAILADKIKAIEVEEPDASDGYFSQSFEVEHSVIIPDFFDSSIELLVSMTGRLFGNVKSSKMGDEPDWQEISSRNFDAKIDCYLNGETIGLNDDEIYGIVEKLVII